MVRSKTQPENFPFFKNEKTTQKNSFKNNHLDNVDKLLSFFAFAFFGVILFLLVAESTQNPNKVNNDFAVIKNASAAKLISTDDYFSKDNQQEKIQPEITASLVAHNNSIETSASVFISSPIDTKIKDSNSNEIVTYPVSISKIPTTNFNRSPNAKKKGINKVIKKETISVAKMNAKKVTKTKKKKSVSKKLEINSKITDDLLPASYFSAKAKANHEGKTMLIKFGAKWCLPCRQMEKTIFKNQMVMDYMKSNYVTLSVDVDDFDGYNLKAYYNVTSLPTMLLFNAKGEFLAKYVNSMSSDKFMTVLENHKPIEQTKSPVANVIKKTKLPSDQLNNSNTTKGILASASITNIIAKKKNGNAILNLKNKAKNWRSTSIEFSTSHLFDGHIIVNVRNLTTDELLHNESIPLAPNTNLGAVTDITTSYQLDISHEKKKDKLGEYVLEIFHASPQRVRLIGKTSFLKDGQFIWKK